MKFLSDLLVQGDGNEIFLKSADHNISRIIPRGTGANLDKGLFSLFDTGTEDVRIDTAGNSWFNGGNVGIGTAAPGASLHVASTTNDFVAKFSHSTATGYAPGSILLEASQATSRGQGIYHYNTNADKAWFTGVPYNVSSNKWIVANKPDTTFNPDVAQLSHALLTIEDNGRVGIGTTSPDTLLHIESTISTSSPIFTIQNDNDIKLKLGAVRSGAGTAPDSTFIAYDGDLRFIADADSTTEVVRIDSSGNVGIGTTSPSKKLHVNGSYKLGTNAYIQYDAAYPYTINIQNTASAGDIKLQSANGENKILLQPSTGGIDFYTNSSERMRITDGGNVGIGTTAPGAKLNVVGHSKFNGTNHHSHFNYSGDSSEDTYIRGGKPGAKVYINDSHNSNVLIASGGGNVGIGTTSPGERLHVYHATTNILGYLQSGDADATLAMADNGGSVRIQNTSGNLRFLTGGTASTSGSNTSEVMRITSSNVGIGTTSPGYKLSVDDNSVTNIPKTLLQLDAASITDNGGYNIDFRTSSNDAADRYVARIRGIRESTGALSQLSFWTESGSALLQRMTIRASGNVGIGTTTPGNTLHVYKNATIGVISSPTVANAGLRIQDSGANMYVDGNSFVISTSGYLTTTGSNDFDIGTNSTSRIKIKGDGNVGIGTTAPGAKLDVRGSGGYLRFDTSSSNGSIKSDFNLQLYADPEDDNSSGYQNIQFFTAGTSEKMRIDYSGRVGIGTTSPTTKLYVHNGEATIASTTDGVKLSYSNGNSSGIIDTAFSDNNLEFRTNGTTKMWIANGGNVGIGTTAPSQKLEVAGDVLINNGLISTLDSTGSLYIDINYGNAYGGRNFRVSNNGVNYFNIDATALATFAGDVSLADSKKLKFGTGSDLEIYHNGLTGNNNIDNINGDLYMSQYANDKDIIFRSDDGSGGIATYFTIDGGNEANLFSKNVKLLDDVKLRVGTSNDLEIYHDGSNSYINDTGTGDLIIKGGNDIIFKDAVDNLLVNMNQSNSVELYYGGAKKFETTSTGVTVTGKISGLTAGTANTDAVNVQQLNNATTGTLIYKGTWSAAPTTTSVLDGAVSSAGSIVIDAVNPGISVGATITGTGISGTVTVSNIAADGITIAISSAQTIADGVTLTFTTVGGTPDLSQASRKVTGHYYICETAGAVTPNGAGTTPNEWAVGDWATFSDLTTDAWQKIDNSSVLSGAGTGGTVPVWSGTGTSVTLADAPITVSGGDTTITGNLGVGAVNASYNLYNNGTSYFNGSVIVDATFTQTGGAASTFSGDVTVGGKTYPKISLTDNQGVARTFSVGTNNETFTVRNETASSDAFTISNANNATFAGDVTVNGSHLILANGTTSAAATDYLYIGGAGLASADAAIYIGNGGGNTVDGYGYRIYYSGAGSGNNNKLIFKSENYQSAEIDMLTFTADGKSTFSQDATFAGKVSIGGGDTSTAQVALKGQQSLLSFVRGTSGDAQFFMSSDSSRLYFSHTDIQSTNLILTLNQDKTATFAGDVTVGALTSGATAQLVINHEGGSGAVAKFMSRTNRAFIQVGDNDTNGYLVAEGDEFAIGRVATVSGNSIIIDASHNATFAGDITATANYSAGNSKIIYKAQRSGGAVAGDWSYDDATTDMSLGTSTAHSFSLKTGNTRALTLDTSQNATFAGNVQTGHLGIGTAPTTRQLSVFRSTAGSIANFLHYTDSSTFQGLYIQVSQTTNDVIFQSSGSGAGGFKFYAGNTEKAGINASGNLTLSGSISATSGSFTGDVTADNITSTSNSGDASIYINSTRPTLGFTDTNSFTDPNDIYLIRAGNDILQFQYYDDSASSTTETFNITSAGNATFAGTISSGTITSTGIVKASSTFQATGGDMTFYVNNVGEAMRVQQNTGEVGIGTTDPKSKLHVNGGIQMAGDTAAASADKVGTMRYRTGTEYVEVNGTNLITNPNFATDTAWTKETGWTITGGKLVATAAAGTAACYQAPGLTSGSVYKCTFTISEYTSGGVSFRAGTAAASTFFSAVGTYSVIMTAGGAMQGRFGLQGNSSTLKISECSIVEVTAEDASYADMCMQTGSSTYEWVNIVRNTY